MIGILSGVCLGTAAMLFMIEFIWPRPQLERERWECRRLLKDCQKLKGWLEYRARALQHADDRNDTLGRENGRLRRALEHERARSETFKRAVELLHAERVNLDRVHACTLVLARDAASSRARSDCLDAIRKVNLN